MRDKLLLDIRCLDFRYFRSYQSGEPGARPAHLCPMTGAFRAGVRMVSIVGWQSNVNCVLAC
jgi:hypothetical protein